MRCKHCGTTKWYNGYHMMIGKELCGRCTDKLLSLINDRDVDEFWTDSFALKEGMERFPMPSFRELQYLKKRAELMRPVMELDYKYKSNQF